MSRCRPFIAAVGLLLAACSDPEPARSAGPLHQPEQVGKPANPVVALPPTVLEVPPAAMRDAWNDTFHLRPDARFLRAVADVHRLLTGGGAAASPTTAPASSAGASPTSAPAADLATATWKDGRWVIRYRDLEVGTLPELPDFADATALLAAWADQLEQTHPLKPAAGDYPGRTEVKARIDRFLAPELTAALDTLDAAWKAGQRHATLLEDAARALTRLDLQQLDRLELADALPARALAALVLARKAAPGVDLGREEALLADGLGYTAHAAKVAKGMPPADAVARYVRRDDAALTGAADASGAAVETRYLALLRVAAQRDLKAWEAARKRYFPGDSPDLATLRTGLGVDALALAPKIGASVVQASLEALGVPQPATTAEAITAFERALAMKAGAAPGPFHDATLASSTRRAAFYGGLHLLGIYALDSLASKEATTSFAESLGSPIEGPAGEFQRWYQDLAAVYARKAKVPVLIDDLTALPTLGGPAHLRTYRLAAARTEIGDPARLEAARRLAARLDSRVMHRMRLGTIAYRDLFDLKQAAALFRGVLEAAPADHLPLQVWFAGFTGKKAADLPAMLKGNALPADLAEAVRSADSQELVPSAVIEAEMRRLVREAPGEWKVRERLVKYLEKEQRYSDARPVIAEWLRSHDPSDGMDFVFATTGLARMYYHEGQYQKGWEAIEPVLAGGQAGALQRGSLLLAKLARFPEAEQLIGGALGRYPRAVHIRSAAAQVAWMAGKPDEAARVLQDPSGELTSADWLEDIARDFHATFAGKPAAETLEAFKALHDAKIDPMALRHLATPFATAGQYEVAFNIVAPLRVPGIEALEFVSQAYGYLKRWKGEAAAMEWITKAVPAPMRDPLSMYAFKDGHGELLWTLIDPKGSREEDFVWLMRAASSARAGATDPHRAELVAHYQSPGSAYHNVGRFLMGLATEAEMLAQIQDKKQRCEIAYYIGLRAEGEKRLEDASDWYHVAVATGLTRNGEYRWALDTLVRWAGAGKRLG